MPTTTCELRVRYAETDQMGVAYYGSHFTWFEVGRTDLLRQLGLTYRELEAQDVFLPVIEARCRYHKPARYDDVLRITTEASRRNRIEIAFRYRIERVGEEILLAAGETRHVAVDRRGRPRRLPEILSDLLS